MNTIDPAVHSIMTWLDDPETDLKSLLDCGTTLQHSLSLVTTHDPAKPLSMVCLHLVVALARLRVEPANELSVEVFERSGDRLRILRQPQLKLLADWYAAIGLLLREFRPGATDPSLRTRMLEEVAYRLASVGDLAIEQGDEVRASLAYSLAAEVQAHLQRATESLKCALIADQFDTIGGHELLARRRDVNERLIASEGTYQVPFGADYRDYLYVRGELLAAIK